MGPHTPEKQSLGDITKTNKPMNNILVEVEGTNELVNNEAFATWTPAFIRPDGTLVPASIVSFTAPSSGAGPKPYKISILINNNAMNQGTWYVRSTLQWMNPVGGQIKEKSFTIP